MVAKTVEWKLERITQEFDPSLDAEPVLKQYALRAAEYLDREAGDNYSAVVRWSARPVIQVAPPLPHASNLSMEMTDSVLGGSIHREFSAEDLSSKWFHFTIRHYWTDFLLKRGERLRARVFQHGTEGGA